MLSDSLRGKKATKTQMTGCHSKGSENMLSLGGLMEKCFTKKHIISYFLKKLIYYENT